MPKFIEKDEDIKNRKKSIIVQSLQLNGGNITNAAKAAKVSRMSIYRWADADPDFKLRMEEAMAGHIDRVEGALYKNAIEGNTTAQIFYLKSKRPQVWNKKQVESDADKLDKDISEMSLSDIEKEIALLKKQLIENKSEQLALGAVGESEMNAEAENEFLRNIQFDHAPTEDADHEVIEDKKSE